MPTTLPRTTLTWRNIDAYKSLADVAKDRKQPLADLVMEIIISASQFVEDLELMEIGKARLKSFKKENSLSTKDILEWNRNR